VGSASDRRRPAGHETRAKLIRAAEELFAEQGIYGVPLREISRAAGQANRSVVHYYFGDRLGLVHAILDRHDTGVDAHRHVLLDEYERRRDERDGGPVDEDDLRALVEAFVMPLVAKLGDPDGGRAFLRVAAEFASRPMPLEALVPNPRPEHSMVRWHDLLDPLVPAEERTVLHSRFPAIRFAFAELARRAAASPRPDDELFVSHLVDLVTAVVAAGPSASTTVLIRRKRRKRTR
jgi:AcrR family transcriptional regulator